MNTAQRRHNLTDREWEKIKPYTIGEKGTRGGILLLDMDMGKTYTVDFADVETKGY